MIVDLSHRASSWRLRTRALVLGRRPLLMGIVNVTPDSFSDGGKFFDPQSAVDHALQLADDGADVLDVGGESTRPYADPLSTDEELARVVPVMERLQGKIELPISIDTSKAAVAEAACQLGAEIINDVTAMTGDEQMRQVALKYKTGVCAMHMQGTPLTMQDDPHYVDVLQDVFAYLKNRKQALIAAGIEQQRICLDPGIGFGKTHQHNLTLLAHCARLHALGCPLLVGHSRKGFIAKVLSDKTRDRTAGTIGVALHLAAQGVQIIRVHDVRPVKDALQLFEACGGIDGEPVQIEAT